MRIMNIVLKLLQNYLESGDFLGWCDYSGFLRLNRIYNFSNNFVIEMSKANKHNSHQKTGLGPPVIYSLRCL
ncbi:hypothetical protein BDZ91DRAFT_709112 [Kalaharituber pfeilii]|nr:hypothetical protein BDZ91DRAFT_709112 [Kalaharituber pfeilii]